MTQRGVTTYLELTDAAQLRPASDHDGLAGVAVTLAQPPDGALNRWFYEQVGREFAWTDHAARDDAWWDARAAAVETWVLTVDGARAGYAELEPGDGTGVPGAAASSVEVAYFGLLPGFQRRGVGAPLLTVVLRRALQLGDRVWLHTCTLDAPAALPNYLARGLRVYRRQSA